jgi:ribosomal protein S12 methylthiotransferase accessory factor
VAADLQPENVHVVSLEGLAVQSAPPGGADASRLNRLGPAVEAFARPAPVQRPPELVLTMARTSHPNLRHPGTDHGWSAGLAPDRGKSEFLARAESAERFATGDAGGRELVRARLGELEGAVDPRELFAFSERQRRGSQAERTFDPGAAYLWTRAIDGRWVAASQVLAPFADLSVPELPGPGSSGVAAHGTLDEARRRALLELIERDAFMWTWVQRVSRERIDPAGLPDETRAHLRAARESGWEATLVNLTLDLKPVVLCALEERDGDGISVGTAAAQRPGEAAAKAVLEAITVLWADHSVLSEPIELADVSTPIDHLRCHRRADAREARAFLLASGEEIAVEDVRCAEGPVEQCVAAVGDPLFVDLSSPTTRPFAVVRAFVPGLVPIAFGYDGEPLGMRRLAEPVVTPDGRELGRSLPLGEAEPIMPHPFS